MDNSLVFSSACEREIKRHQQEMDIYRRIFIDSKADYYLNKFNSFKASKLPIKWNWSSFLFTYYWAFFRKLYALGIFLLVLDIFSSKNIITYFVVQALRSTLLGMFGDYAYHLKLEDEVGKIRFMEGIERDLYINRKGGTNKTLTIMVLGVMALYAVIYSATILAR